MIIVSQEKDIIINFDNITVIGIAQSNDKEIGSITTDGQQQFLAEYETEERAKEVLQEITKIYFDENCEFENGMYHLQKIYEMPKE